MPDQKAKAVLLADRLSTVAEVRQFLADFESAYNALYVLDYQLTRSKRHFHRQYPPDPFYVPLFIPTPRAGCDREPLLLPPEDRLVLNRVSVRSPGFWEFLGSINPLLQLREYLNDRHERMRDKEYRSRTERERLEHENDLLRAQVDNANNTVVAEQIAILRDLGYSKKEIRKMLWEKAGAPLSRLGQHQDTGLIKTIKKVSVDDGEASSAVEDD